MKTTRYFEEEVLRKRLYIQREWCQRALVGIYIDHASQKLDLKTLEVINLPNVIVTNKAN